MVKSAGTLVLALGTAFSAAAFGADASLLKPPAGAKVAIVMFEDLECPDCSRAYPMVWDAANAHKIPVVLHDFPLPRHNWSFEAAVWARYFDQTSVAVGNEFRKYIYANQAQISKDNLQQWVQKFGSENKAPVAFMKDPDGKLAAKVKADYALGQRIGVEHTPTIWVVGNSGVSQPLVEEVKDRDQLGQMIEDMLKKARPAQKADTKTPLQKRR
ncbi:MAG TPA: thioredoxin domain-containing protein [Candidatus Angelobacter sp.]|nr:thioredoxin domain-containing protein [Candidatus Angelobacter sp.]